MKIVVPLFVRIAKSEKGKKYYLNLNYYRNWHYQQSNAIKQKFCENMETLLVPLVFQTPIELTFTLYKSSKRNIDRSNILSIVEKFFCDALVHCGCIKDDNDQYISKTHYQTGGVDKENPRVEIEIV
jgi:Holliday junction resolvase RusA-like endonuclease